MELTEFSAVLRRLTLADVSAVAHALDAVRTETAEEVAEIKAILGVEEAVRRVRRSALAGLASTSAARAVQDAALRAGATLPDPEVTRVARAAAQIARGLVAGESADREVHRLLQPWRPVLERSPAVLA